MPFADAFNFQQWVSLPAKKFKAFSIHQQGRWTKSLTYIRILLPVQRRVYTGDSSCLKYPINVSMHQYLTIHLTHCIIMWHMEAIYLNAHYA